MRVQRVKIRGINRTREAEVNLDSLGPGLIALVGPNGAGKTTFMESAHAARYLSFPSRKGSLTDRARGKDSRIEVDYLVGNHGSPESVRSVVSVDGPARKIEPILLHSTGEPFEECRNSLVRPFGDLVARLFGSEALSLSACLCAQDKSGSFAVLPKAERKDLVLEVLDTTGCQAISERAKVRKTEAEALLSTLRTEIDTLSKEADSITVTEESIACLEGFVSGVREILADFEAQAPAARERVIAATAALEVAKRRAEELDGLKAQAREHEALAARYEAAGKALHVVFQEETAAAMRQDRRPRILSSIEARKQALIRELDALDGKILEAEMEASRLEEYRKAEEEAAKLEESIHAHEEEREALQKERDGHQAQLQQAIQAKADIEALARALADARSASAIIGKTPFGERCSAAGCLFLVGASSQMERIPGLEREIESRGPIPDLDGIRTRIKSAENAVAAKRSEILRDRETLSGLRSKAFRRAAAEAASRTIAEAAAARVSAQENGRKAVEELQQDAIEEEERLRQAVSEIEARRDKAAQENSLRLLEARRKLEEVNIQVDAFGDAGMNGFQQEARAAAGEEQVLQQNISGARRGLSSAETSLAVAVGDRERSRRLCSGIEERKTKAGDAAQDLSEWAFLEKAFGRDGIQALELDAAGPGLSELVNDLLTSCYGNRFEVRFITQVPKRDGKGSKEIFDLEVTDHEEGRVGTLDDLSGGEKVPIGEAVSLALAIYAGRHSGHSFETLFRDETVGACDPQNANRYVAMLRRALEVGAFHQIVFIAQQEQVWRQADAILRFEGGSVEILSGAALE